MKKIASIILLGFYLFIQFSWVFNSAYKYVAHTYFVQQSLQKSIASANDLCNIIIDGSKIDSLKNDDGEIIIDCLMYDIVSSQQMGTKIKLLLKKDTKETIWSIQYNKISDFLHRHKPVSDTALQRLSFTILPFIQSTESSTLLQPILHVNKKFFVYTTCLVPKPIKKLVAPPPDFC